MADSLPKVRGADVLRIAMVAPCYYTVPPFKYGGTERVVAYLIEGLTARGHEVTLYGSNGCNTDADLVECTPIPFADAGIGGTIDEMEKPYVLQLKRVLRDLTKYDVVHIHHGIFPFQPAIFTKPGPYVWTDHCELHVEGKGDTLQKLYDNASAGATSISNSQRSILTGAEYWFETIYHGLPKYLLAPMTSVKPSYLAFLGRLAPEKGAPDAVRIAILAGKQLQVAAKIEEIHDAYYKREVKPMFEKHDVVYVGEIDDKGKSEFLSGAIALVFPIQWSEPFGLVMIEAMACGTPVIAYNRGAVPEVVEEGVTGFIVNTAEEAAAKVGEAANLDRKKIRDEFEKRFTSTVMAKQYEKLFYRIRDGTAWDKSSDDTAIGFDHDESDDNEHVCPGHKHCAKALAEMQDQGVGSIISASVSADASATDTTDDLADGLAELHANEDRASK